MYATDMRPFFRGALIESGMWSVFARTLPERVNIVQVDGAIDAKIDMLLEPELKSVRDKFAPVVAFVESNYPNLQDNQVRG